MIKNEHKPNNGNVTKQVIEWFRLITPALVTITLFMISGINNKLVEIDNRLFTHLTNHEMHIPRQDVVTKAEFSMHCQFSNELNARFQTSVDDIKKDITELLTEIRINQFGGDK